MAPYRNNRTSARSARTQIDHDVFEGLPVRHWRKKVINVNVALEKENADIIDSKHLAWPELPMPRDADLLSPLSKTLLQAARMGQTRKPTTPLMEDEKEPGDEEDIEGDFEMGFVAKRWAIVPKELEGPEPEFLAKRRHGLPSTHSGTVGASGNIAQMRKTKVRKTNTEGQNTVWEVLVPKDQTVSGEVVEVETGPTQAPAPGTIVDGVGVANAEGLVIAGNQEVPVVNRRRPPPPKRKAKGPGRVRKKKVAFAGPNGAPTASVGARGAGDTIISEENENISSRQEGLGDDIIKGNDSTLNGGSQDGDEGSDEGSEEDEDEDGDREEGEVSPSPPPPETPQGTLDSAVVVTETETEAPMPNTSPSPRKPSSEEVKQLQLPVVQAAESEIDTTNVDDEMLDAPTVEITSEAASAFIEDQYAAQSLPDSEAMRLTESLDEASKGVDTGVTQVTPPEATQVLETIQEPTLEASAEPMIEMLAGPEKEFLADTKLDFREESTVENILHPAIEVTAQPTQRVDIDVTQGLLEEPDTATTANLIPQAIAEPITDSAAEMSAEILSTVPMEQATEDISAPDTDILTGSAAHNSPEKVTLATTEPMIQTNFEPPNVPLKEAPSEQIVDRAERKFSFPRPTSSPKAPTPSPPTPIENTFDSKAPYLSPKAPTMSPPTPIDRGISSSPDMPLAQQFQLPPSIDVYQGPDQAPKPKMQDIPNPGRFAIEAVPAVEPSMDSQIPVEHDSLDGLAAPRAVGPHVGEVSGEEAQYFSDGEEDLLGSLERSLSSRGREV